MGTAQLVVRCRTHTRRRSTETPSGLFSKYPPYVCLSHHTHTHSFNSSGERANQTSWFIESLKVRNVTQRAAFSLTRSPDKPQCGRGLAPCRDEYCVGLSLPNSEPRGPRVFCCCCGAVLHACGIA